PALEELVRELLPLGNPRQLAGEIVDRDLEPRQALLDCVELLGFRALLAILDANPHPDRHGDERADNNENNGARHDPPYGARRREVSGSARTLVRNCWPSLILPISPVRSSIATSTRASRRSSDSSASGPAPELFL